MRRKQQTPEELDAEFKRVMIRDAKRRQLFRTGCALILIGLLLPVLAVIVFVLVATVSTNPRP